MADKPKGPVKPTLRSTMSQEEPANQLGMNPQLQRRSTFVQPASQLGLKISSGLAARDNRRNSSQIGDGIKKQQELDEDDIGGQFDAEQDQMLNDMHAQQINVKYFDLQPSGTN